MERPQHQPVEGAADYRPKRGVLACQAPAADHVVVLQERDQQGEVGDVELTVGVSEGGVVEIGRTQAVADCRAVARLVLVAYDFEVHAEARSDRPGDVRGAIGGTVVDDDDVELLGQARQHLVDAREQPAEVLALVVSRHDQAEAREASLLC